MTSSSPALQIGTFDNGCFHNAASYPTFTPAGVGGIIEIGNPGGVGSLGSEIDDVLLAKGATYYTIDERPQSPHEAILYEASYDTNPTAYNALSALYSLQGPTSSPYMNTGAIGDLRAAITAEWGLTTTSDSTFDARLTAAGISTGGSYVRLQSQFRTDPKPTRLKIRYNADNDTYYVVEIRYLDMMTYAGVVIVPTGGGGGA